MSVYVTTTCNSCKSDLAYGNAVASVTIRNGAEYYTHHTPNCGCTNMLNQCNRLYIPEPVLTECKYCNSNDLHTQYDSDE